MKALVSIHPEYADLIASGKKTVEYRRRRFSRLPDALIIYATRPVRQIIGEAVIGGYTCGPVMEIWKRTNGDKRGGISEADFRKYFAGCKEAYAYEIESFKPYDPPKTLADFGMTRPPQFFRYLD